MDSISEKIYGVIGQLMNIEEPREVLIITENQEGEIIDTRYVDVNFAIFILREAERRQEIEEKTEGRGSLWWHPSK